MHLYRVTALIVLGLSYTSSDFTLDYGNWIPLIGSTSHLRRNIQSPPEIGEGREITRQSRQATRLSIVPANVVALKPKPQREGRTPNSVQLVYLPKGSINDLRSARVVRVEGKLDSNRSPRQTTFPFRSSQPQTFPHSDSEAQASFREVSPRRPTALVAQRGREDEANKQIQLLEAALNSPQGNVGELPRVFIAPTHLPPPPGYVKIPLLPSQNQVESRKTLPGTFLTSEFHHGLPPGFVQLPLPESVAHLSHDIPFVHLDSNPHLRAHFSIGPFQQVPVGDERNQIPNRGQSSPTERPIVPVSDIGQVRQNEGSKSINNEDPRIRIPIGSQLRPIDNSNDDDSRNSLPSRNQARPTDIPNFNRLEESRSHIPGRIQQPAPFDDPNFTQIEDSRIRNQARPATVPNFAHTDDSRSRTQFRPNEDHSLTRTEDSRIQIPDRSHIGTFDDPHFIQNEDQRSQNNRIPSRSKSRPTGAPNLILHEDPSADVFNKGQSKPKEAAFVLPKEDSKGHIPLDQPRPTNSPQFPPIPHRNFDSPPDSHHINIGQTVSSQQPRPNFESSSASQFDQQQRPRLTPKPVHSQHGVKLPSTQFIHPEQEASIQKAPESNQFFHIGSSVVPPSESSSGSQNFQGHNLNSHSVGFENNFNSFDNDNRNHNAFDNDNRNHNAFDIDNRNHNAFDIDNRNRNTFENDNQNNQVHSSPNFISRPESDKSGDSQASTKFPKEEFSRTSKEPPFFSQEFPDFDEPHFTSEFTVDSTPSIDFQVTQSPFQISPKPVSSFSTSSSPDNQNSVLPVVTTETEFEFKHSTLEISPKPTTIIKESEIQTTEPNTVKPDSVRIRNRQRLRPQSSRARQQHRLNLNPTENAEKKSLQFTTSSPFELASGSTVEHTESSTLEPSTKPTIVRSRPNQLHRRRKPKPNPNPVVSQTTVENVETSTTEASTLFPPFSVARKMKDKEISTTETPSGLVRRDPLNSRGRFGSRIRSRTQQAGSSSDTEDAVPKESENQTTDKGDVQDSLVETTPRIRQRGRLAGKRLNDGSRRPNQLHKRRRVLSRVRKVRPSLNADDNLDAINDAPADGIKENELRGAESARVLFSQSPDNQVIDPIAQTLKLINHEVTGEDKSLSVNNQESYKVHSNDEDDFSITTPYPNEINSSTDSSKNIFNLLNLKVTTPNENIDTSTPFQIDNTPEIFETGVEPRSINADDADVDGYVKFNHSFTRDTQLHESLDIHSVTPSINVDNVERLNESNEAELKNPTANEEVEPQPNTLPSFDSLFNYITHASQNNSNSQLNESSLVTNEGVPLEHVELKHVSLSSSEDSFSQLENVSTQSTLIVEETNKTMNDNPHFFDNFFNTFSPENETSPEDYFNYNDDDEHSQGNNDTYQGSGARVIYAVALSDPPSQHLNDKEPSVQEVLSSEQYLSVTEEPDYHLEEEQIETTTPVFWEELTEEKDFPTEAPSEADTYSDITTESNETFMIKDNRSLLEGLLTTEAPATSEKKEVTININHNEEIFANQGDETTLDPFSDNFLESGQPTTSENPKNVENEVINNEPRVIGATTITEVRSSAPVICFGKGNCVIGSGIRRRRGS